MATPPDGNPPPPRPLTTIPARRRAAAVPSPAAPAPVVPSAPPLEPAPAPAPAAAVEAPAPPRSAPPVPSRIAPPPDAIEPPVPDPHPQPLAPSPPPLLRRWWPLAGGLAGLALAGAGELLVENKDKSQLSPILYLAGVAVFAISAWPLRPAPTDLPDETIPPKQSAILPLRGSAPPQSAIALAGIGLAVLLNLVAAALIHENRGSIPGAWLWAGSLILLAGAGLGPGAAAGLAARWGGVRCWPAARQGRIALAVGAAGDPGAGGRPPGCWASTRCPSASTPTRATGAPLAIQIMRGATTPTASSATAGTIISMVYFWLLARVMKVVGIGYVGARVLGALAGHRHRRRRHLDRHPPLRLAGGRAGRGAAGRAGRGPAVLARDQRGRADGDALGDQRGLLPGSGAAAGAAGPGSGPGWPAASRSISTPAGGSGRCWRRSSASICSCMAWAGGG